MGRFDLCVVGAGPGGYVAAVRAAELGMKVACVDKGPLGGTCLHVGCIPSKALLQSTEMYALLRETGAEHGISCEGLIVDFQKLQKRKEKIVQGLCQGVGLLFQQHGVSAFEGEASFTGPHELTLSSGEKVEADRFILATGSEPIPLPFLPFDEKVVLSSTGALALKSVPKTLIVVGGGAIGLELASVYSRLGSEVTVVEMLDMVAPGIDGALSKELLKLLKKQGFTFSLGTQVQEGRVEKKKVTLEIAKGKEKEEISAAAVLVSIGRRPYSKGLGLETIGVTVDQRGFIPVDSCFRSNVPHIFAIGDLIEGPMLAHRASAEGIALVEQIAGRSSSLNYLTIPNVIYTHPEVASVGVTEEEAKERGVSISIGRAPFTVNGRARCMGDAQGFVKVIGDKQTGRLIGLHIIGPHASEMIAEGAVAIEGRMTVQQLARLPHAHPTLSEAIQEACLSAS